MNERMKRIIGLVQKDIKTRTADIEYQKMDESDKEKELRLKNIKPKAPRLSNMANLMVGID